MKKKYLNLFSILFFIIIVSAFLYMFMHREVFLSKYTAQYNEMNSNSELRCYGNYIADGEFIENIDTNTTVENFLLAIKIDENNIQVLDNEDKPKQKDELVTTGTKIKIIDNGLQKTYIACVAGDTNGDGVSDILDILQINKYRLGKVQLSNEQMISGDVDYNGIIDILDIYKVNKYRLKKISTLLPDEIKAVELSLNTTKVIMDLGGMTKLEASVKPDNVTNNKVKWTSNNSDIVEISEDGVIIAKNEGTATIIVQTMDGSNLSKTAEICVVVPLKSIVLNSTELSMNEGDKQQLIVNFNPENATNKNLEWSSSNENIATVNSDGWVTAVSQGECVITVEGENGVKAECNIIVNSSLPELILITELQLNPTNLRINKGNSNIIQVSINPEDATNKTLRWESSNNKIATVDENGRITGVGKGTAYITASTVDGSDISKTVTVNVDVLVENIVLTPNNLSLRIGEIQKIYTEVLPNDATNKSLEWTSDNEDIAIIDDNGNVTAKKVGTTTISAKTKDGSNIVAKANVTVIEEIHEILVSAIVVEEENIVLNNGFSQTIETIIVPNNATNKQLSWTSSDEDIVAVNDEGKVTAKTDGEATITISAQDGSNVSTQINIKVITPVENIALNEQNVNLDLSGESSVQLLATITPDTATDKNITWTSSDERIASVNESGLVTAKSNGNVTIIAESTNGKKAKCNVTVQTSAISIRLNATSKKIDSSITKNFQLIGTISPSTTTNKTIKWTSSNPNVATVDENGLVTVKENGTTTIKAITVNNKEATCNITVQTSPTAISLNKEKITIDLSKNSSINQQLSVSYTPSNANINKGITWSSSNENVATISQSGMVTGKANGNAIITATTANGKSTNCTITVQTSPTSIYFTTNKIDNTKFETIKKGSTKTINAVIEPSSANVDTSITYSLVGNSKVASVNSSTGTVTATQAGVMTLNAITANGLTSSIKVNVKIGNTVAKRGNLTSTTNASVFSSSIASYKAGNPKIHMQSFDIDSSRNDSVFYIGYDTNNSEMSYIYGIGGPNRRPEQNGMTLSYCGHQSNMDVEETSEKVSYVWCQTFGSKYTGTGYGDNYAVSRFRYQNDKSINYGPGTVIEKNSNKKTTQTYNNIDGISFVYVKNDGELKTGIMAAIDEDNGLLCLYLRNGNTNIVCQIYDLEEALNLNNSTYKDIPIYPNKSDDTITKYLTFYAKNLGYKFENGEYVRNIVPLATVKFPIPDDRTEGFDLDGDYVYLLEGYKQPTHVTAYNYMYNYNGNKPQFERAIVRASYTDSFTNQMGENVNSEYTNPENGNTYKGFHESEGIKVKNGVIYIGYVGKLEGERVSTILKFDNP